MAVLWAEALCGPSGQVCPNAGGMSQGSTPLGRDGLGAPYNNKDRGMLCRTAWGEGAPERKEALTGGVCILFFLVDIASGHRTKGGMFRQHDGDVPGRRNVYVKA